MTYMYIVIEQIGIIQFMTAYSIIPYIDSELMFAKYQ